MVSATVEFRMSMYRRAMLVVLAFVISGAIPLIANFGSCADMPCCHPTAKVLDQTNTGCCSPATCVKEEKVLCAHDASQRHLLKQLAAMVPHLSLPALIPARALEHSASLSPPRSTGERLSSLSILLI
jgi:hypothetical protein